jgi:hypothetical protein
LSVILPLIATVFMEILADFADNAERHSEFSRAASKSRSTSGQQMFHCHDWRPRRC